MAAKSFLRATAGKVGRALGIVVSTGAANDGDIPALDATGKLDPSTMPAAVTSLTSGARARSLADINHRRWFF